MVPGLIVVPRSRADRVLPTSMLLGTFAWSFVYVASGEAIGFVNSARIGAAFVGPVAATTLLASMPPAAVYLALAGMGLAVVPLVAGFNRRARPWDEGGRSA